MPRIPLVVLTLLAFLSLSLLKISNPRTSEEVRKAGAGIKKAFRKILTYAVPHPGNKVVRADESDYKDNVSQASLHVSGG